MNVVYLSSRQPLADVARLYNRFYDLEDQQARRSERDQADAPAWVYLTPLFAGFFITALMWAMRP